MIWMMNISNAIGNGRKESARKCESDLQKKRLRSDYGTHRPHSTSTYNARVNPTNVLGLSNEQSETRSRLKQKTSLSDLQDSLFPAHSAKYTLPEYKQHLDASEKIQNPERNLSVGTFDEGASGNDLKMKKQRTVEHQKTSSIVEIIRKEQITDRERIWEEMSEIQSSIRHIKTTLEEIKNRVPPRQVRERSESHADQE